MLSGRIVSQCRVPTFMPTRMSPFWMAAWAAGLPGETASTYRPPRSLGETAET